MDCIKDGCGNSIEEQVERRVNVFKLSIDESIKRHTSHILRLFQDGHINDKDKKRLVCSVNSAGVSISLLVEMFENANIKNDLQFNKYVMAISDAICSFNTGVTEEINLTVENSAETEKSI